LILSLVCLKDKSLSYRLKCINTRTLLAVTFYCGLMIFSNNAKSEITNSKIVGCDGKSKTAVYEFKGEILLPKQHYDSLPEESKKIAIDAEIQAQIKFLIGLSREYKNENILKFVPSSIKSENKIIKFESKKIKLPLRTEPALTNIQNKAEDLYFSKLGDELSEAMSVEYKTRIVIAHCESLKKSSSDQELKKSIESLVVPKIPKLAYWIFNSSDKAKNLNEHKNCFNFDIASYDTNTDYMWYYWNQKISGKNGACEGASRKDLLTNFEINEIKQIDSELNEKPLLSPGSFKKVRIIIGEDTKYNSQLKEIYNLDFLNKIEKLFSDCNKNENYTCLSAFDKAFPNPPVNHPKGAAALIYTLGRLGTIFKGVEIKSKLVGTDYLLFDVSATTKRDKKVLLQFYYGQTSFQYSKRANEKYWTTLHNSILEDDQIIYYGHAGVGSNLKIENIISLSSLKTFSKRNNPLVFAIFNCEAYSYFGNDFDQMIENKVKSNFFVSTGTLAHPRFLVNYLKAQSELVKFSQFSEVFGKNRFYNDFFVFQEIEH
jgi:hypothetical protein